MKFYESTYPIDIILLGPYAVMLVPNALAYLIKQTYRFERWSVGRLAGGGRVFVLYMRAE